MKNVNQLIATAAKSGFEVYGSFNEGELQHEILTCTKGKFDGEVIDLYYDYNTGDVAKVEYSTQFKGQQPTFSF
jgi:hypothetical protein